MKKVFFSAAVLAAVALTGCSKDNEQPDSRMRSEYITVSTSIGALTRVSVEGNASRFEDGDKISVYAWLGTAAEVNTSRMVVNNSVNTLAAGKWTSEPMMKWNDMTTPHFFLAVYPPRTVTDFKADAVTVDPTRQTDADLLVAVNAGNSDAGISATANPVSLRFDHVMSKLVVKLEYRNEFAETPQVTSVSTEARNTGTVDYLKGLVTPAGEAGAFALPPVRSNAEYASVLIPQAVQKISVLINGRNYLYTHATPLLLEKGKVQVVKLIVGRNRIELNEVLINDWNNASEISGGEAVD